MFNARSNNDGKQSQPANPEPVIPELNDNRQKPEGVVPRQSQAYVIAGLSILILMAVLFSNKRAKPITSVATPTALDVAPSPNEAVQQFSRELNQEQRDNERQRAQQKAAQNAASQTDTSSAGTISSRGSGSDPAVSQSEAPHDSIADAERALRFKSRFESNLVSANLISANNGCGSEAVSVKASGLSDPLFSHEENEQAGSFPFSSPQAALSDRTSFLKDKKPTEISINNAHGQPYAIFEGTTIDAVLVNRLNGDFSGPVKVMVTNPVFSQDRQHVLIPEGTFLLGEVGKVAGFGQRRLAVTFHRMIMPDGYSVDLDQFHGLDAAGETGLADQVNNHYLQIFGSSIALGVIAGAAEASANTGFQQSGTDSLQQGVASSLAQSGAHVLDRFLNILPTITIREGHRIKVYLTEDLLLPAFENHAMPGDL